MSVWSRLGPVIPAVPEPRAGLADSVEINDRASGVFREARREALVRVIRMMGAPNVVYSAIPEQHTWYPSISMAGLMLDPASALVAEEGLIVDRIGWHKWVHALEAEQPSIGSKPRWQELLEAADEARREQNQAAIALIEGWAAEESTYDEDTLRELLPALEESREAEGRTLTSG